MKQFIEGKKYYCRRDPDRYLIVERKTPTTVIVLGLFRSREKLLVDNDGTEYFEIKDPFKGIFRYSAANEW